MQPLGDVPGFILGCAAGLGGGREAIHEGRDVLGGAGRRQRRGGGHLPVVEFLDHVGPDELVAMARHRANEPRLAGIVAERTPERSDSLRQRSVRHDDVAPHLLEDGLLGHRVSPAHDEQQQKIEVLRDQRNRPPVSQQQPLARREHEVGEPKSDGRSHEASSLSEEPRAARMPFGGPREGIVVTCVSD